MGLDETTLRDIGRCVMVGVRGAGPGDDALRRDLDACVEARCRAIVLFDRDMPSGGPRNVESPGQLRDLIAFVRETLGQGTIVAVDQEGGSVQRLRAASGFVESPSASDFAAMAPDRRTAEADALARQLGDLGIDLNFAPCADVAINLESPIIASRGRTFGSDPEVVIACAVAVRDAHHRAGVSPCVKHFPGHGSARGDSHRGLPDITDVWDEAVELAPFAALLKADSPVCCMTAHLLHRVVDAEFPASLSRAWTTGVLRDRLRFAGVVVTDSLDMRAVADRFPTGEAAALAIAAGADLALDANNMPGASRVCPATEMASAIARAIEDGRIEREAVANSARRVDAMAAFSGRGVRGASPRHV